MKIAFVDTIAFDYDVDFPLNQPLGAGNSAICYLAKELARASHDVTIFNGRKEPSIGHGVTVRPISDIAMPAEILNGYEVAIICSGAVGAKLRDAGVTIPLILWTQHAHDQPGVRPLLEARERYAWTGIAYVSEWQRRHYEIVFGMPADRGRILRNGIAPPFETIHRGEPWFTAQRPPVLAYTSTPFRGLQTLLSAFPRIREAIPGTTLRIYSSMKVYQKRPEDDDFGCLYDACRAMEGVEYVGSLGQAQLADELSRVDALTYPSIFPEGLCVAIIEAMAAGLAIFTTNLGALPETTSEHAFLTEWQGDGLARRFAENVIAGLQAMQRDPFAAMASRQKQLSYIRQHFLWRNIASQWIAWLNELTRRSTPTVLLKTGS